MPEDGKENVVFHHLKIFFNVSFENITLYCIVLAHLPLEIIKPLNCFERSFPYPVCIGIINECFFEYRLEHIAQCMMYHPITKIRLADSPCFRIADNKMDKRLRLIAVQQKLCTKRKNVFFQIFLKCDDVIFCRLVLSCFCVGKIQVIVAAELKPQALGICHDGKFLRHLGYSTQGVMVMDIAIVGIEPGIVGNAAEPRSPRNR